MSQNLEKLEIIKYFVAEQQLNKQLVLFIIANQLVTFYLQKKKKNTKLHGSIFENYLRVILVIKKPPRCSIHIEYFCVK